MARPKALPDDMVEVRTTVPAEVNTAVDEAVATTGISKYSILRDALIVGLALEMGMLAPDVDLPVTKHSSN